MKGKVAFGRMLSSAGVTARRAAFRLLPFFLFSEGLFTGPVRGQSTVSNYSLYTAKEGLASSQVNSLFIDSKGYLWVGTAEGVNRFDGTSFSNLVANATDFAAGEIRCIAQVNDSTILVGTATGGLLAFNLNSNRFENGLIKDSLLKAGSTTEVSSITVLPKGRCLITGGVYVFLLDRHLNVIRRKRVSAFYRHAYSFCKQPAFLNADSTRILSGRPFIRQFDIATFQEGSLPAPFARLNNLPNDFSNALYKTSDSSLLYSPWDEGLNYFTNGVNHCLPGTKGNGQTRQICKDPQNDKAYWIAMERGLGLFDEAARRFSLLTLEAVPDKRVLLNSCTDLVFDKFYNLWIGTAGGLVKISNTKKAFRELTLSAKFNWLDLDDAVKDRNGNLWLSSWGNNIIKVDPTGKILHHYNEQRDGTSRLAENFLLVNDTLYAAMATGTFYFNEKEKRFAAPPFYIPDSLKKGADKLVYKDSHGNWWIGFFGRGLYRYNERTGRSNFYTLFRPPSSPEYLEMLYPTDIAEDRWGNLWMGRVSHSAQFTKWDWRTETFTVVPLHINGFTTRNLAICNLAIDKADNVWMGTVGFGVLQYDIKEERWTQYGKSKGLKSNIVPSVAIDKEGAVWAGTNNGLAVLYKGKDRFITLTEEDGLPFTQVFWAGFPHKDNTDSLLIAGSNKLAWVYVRALKHKADTPAINLQYVYVNNEPFFDFDRHSFHHTQAAFRFSFTSVNLQNGNNDVYAYRLKGAGNVWIEAGQTRDVSFSNLAPGQYVFEVKARNAEGIWSAPTAYAFTIRPPYYGRWWFHLLMACVVSAVVYGIYRYRIARIKALYQMRSRISRDLHDEVGSTLSGISLMNEMAKAKANGNAALNEKIADNLQKVQNAMQDIVWAVNPKNDDLTHLLLRFSTVAQELLETKGMAYRFTAPPQSEGLKLSMERRREVYLIYKECLNNIAKYSGATEVAIALLVKGQTLQLLVTDNGKGFDSATSHSGNGLRNMRERTDSLHGTLHIQSAEGKGTALELKVPLR